VPGKCAAASVGDESTNLDRQPSFGHDLTEQTAAHLHLGPEPYSGRWITDSFDGGKAFGRQSGFYSVGGRRSAVGMGVAIS
jgi:hypothetical protein